MSDQLILNLGTKRGRYSGKDEPFTLTIAIPMDEEPTAYADDMIARLRGTWTGKLIINKREEHTLYITDRGVEHRREGA